MSRPDFLKTWASSRPSIPAISDPDYALGFANYLGAIPPSTDDHDYIMNLQDQRAVWLGAQMLLAVGHEWQSDITYNQYAVVRSPVNGRLYRSISSGNVGNEPSVSSTNWILEDLLYQRGLVLFTSPGITNWTVPLAMQLGIIKPKVRVIGGGGGASRISATATGSGGGGGGAAEKIVDLTGVTSVTVTVGAGGLGKDGTSFGDGTAGGTSSFGAFLSATGGQPGLTSGVRSNGGSGTGGDVNYNGQQGGASAGGGQGGNSPFFPGGQTGGVTGTAPGFNGANGVGPGGGGGGGNPASTGGAGPGGNGHPGQVMIEW